MDLQQFLRLVLRGWWVIALAVLVTVGSTAFFVGRQSPEYRAVTTVELVPQAALEDRYVVDVYNLLDKRNLSNTMARKAEGSSMAQLVAGKLGVSQAVIDSANITAIVLPDSNIIEIRASSTDRELAAVIANTVADEMLGQNRGRILQLEAIDRATPPSAPIAPQLSRMLTLALVSGLVLGMLLVVLEHMLRGGSAGPGDGARPGGDRKERPQLGSPMAAGGAMQIRDK
jgi:succinoglycan biosynthesis transport protein ExoP